MRSIRAAAIAATMAVLLVPMGGEAGGGGCAINVTYVNKEPTQSKVDQGESEVKSKQFGFWGTWASIGWPTARPGSS